MRVPPISTRTDTLLPYPTRFLFGGVALAAADALRRERELLALALQQGRRLAGDARAGGAQRMAERDGAAVEVGLVEVEAEFVGAGQRLRGEGLVQLDDVEILHGQTGALQGLEGRRHRTHAHDLEVGRATWRERVCQYV